jgi:hypothetical protein
LTIPQHHQERWTLYHISQVRVKVRAKGCILTAARSFHQLYDMTLTLTEILRILSLTGLFAIITTMPPDIFRQIIIDPLQDQYVQEQHAQKEVLTNWKTCKKKKIRTNEGGYVYFYPIRKIADIPLRVTKRYEERGVQDPERGGW